MIFIILLQALFFVHQPPTMKAIDIINNLADYKRLLDTVRQNEAVYLNEKEKSTTLLCAVRNEYNFITLTLHIKKGDQREQLYCRITYELENNTAVFKDLYCDDASQKQQLENVVKRNVSTHQRMWSTKHNANSVGELVTKYLSIADKIAENSINCAAGDNYYPTAFSRIEVNDNCIVLQQTNHMNAKSLDHKNNYSLRELQFTIPLNGSKLTTTHYDDQFIGDMTVNFSDRSSQNNKRCGDAIQNAIDQEKFFWKGD